MDERLPVEVMGVAGSGAQRGKGEDPAGVRRGRPGRRSLDEGREAVVELLSGKATVYQVAFRFGGHPKTVEKWREVALGGGTEHSMRQGGASGRGSWSGSSGCWSGPYWNALHDPGGLSHEL